jgi:hypothetical protein
VRLLCNTQAGLQIGGDLREGRWFGSSLEPLIKGVPLSPWRGPCYRGSVAPRLQDATAIDGILTSRAPHLNGENGQDVAAAMHKLGVAGADSSSMPRNSIMSLVERGNLRLS